MNAPITHPRPPVALEVRVVTGAGGGPDKTILNTPRFLEPLGYRTVCAYLHPPDDPGFEQIRTRAASLGAPLVAVEDRGPLDPRVLSELLNLCRRERVSIWHGHEYKSNALGLLLSRFWPMSLVTTVHGWVERTARTPLYYRIDRFCLPRYERVLCVSEDLHRQSLQCGVAPERCLLVENGIDLEQYRRRHSLPEAKQRLGFDPRRLLVGAVGRLSAEKGFDRLIRAAGRLLRDGVDFDLAIVGEGNARPALEAQIAAEGLADRVRLLGFRPDTIDLFQAMDVFALSSFREGLPNVVLEAMALGVPVVATRVAGVPRVIRDGENGVLVEIDDEAGLSAALGRLLADGRLRQRLADAGRLTVESQHSFAARIERIRDIYDEVLRDARHAGKKRPLWGSPWTPTMDRNRGPVSAPTE